MDGSKRGNHPILGGEEEEVWKGSNKTKEGHFTV